MSELKRFYCLRCQHRFDVDFDPKKSVERSCPGCGSNSVRAETPAAAAAFVKRQASARRTEH